MNLKEIQQLIDMINNSDLDEATIEEGDFKITLKRSSANPVTNNSQPVSTHAVPQAVSAPQPVIQPQVKDSEPSKPMNEGLVEIRSPIVGTFYRAPSPEADAFVNVNDRIENGQVLCIIEAMKLMNEIESDFSGAIVEILVENGQPVEYDQVLFLIKP
ncbi:MULTISPECIES: acetyl-CoA carboxylase biotin carboxyl carrier protein [unclassified Prosthecochloris]|uniref:acetyl-CoA carboxylase biotin carboxyl carrier protein n=1 Tax=unclassified Prosthecochloris TaxID=2632826 RepID=UPI00223D39D3|nr:MULTISPECIES: acetyl-CoA carboxylase biotin carboxyl carrier protein [unclassified Prosthecochloris]UZJ37401.1 acetyl-CoA carboxylase biotin carboxyl carrier protein [Prosthecochloris sp. SCSIO W1103]UZJ39223.1 acetyl-CoA carboxylase biotin carboxyl carrier protein [Prosthecochloris sp. SCSIO W1102]